ncbi:hypothetical protein [Entomobacter blattae]|uniref:Uncharacterized protein n=1 Tax=Entomobacter blattae TaxID=2762277 RepID=A0A7H1NT83_9PROT|nr:hypothetical protein [Entomobacter blattae]QNT78993.1 hypothetical protein JGUZn3_17770 [Entomobacter blattae]
MKKNILMALAFSLFAGTFGLQGVHAESVTEVVRDNQAETLKQANSDKKFMEWLLTAMKESKESPNYPGRQHDFAHSKTVINDFIVASYKLYNHDISKEQYRKFMSTENISLNDRFQIDYIINKIQ